MELSECHLSLAIATTITMFRCELRISHVITKMNRATIGTTFYEKIALIFANNDKKVYNATQTKNLYLVHAGNLYKHISYFLTTKQSIQI